MKTREEIVEALSNIPGTTVSGGNITIRPRVSDNTVRIRANKNGKGYVTSYTVSIGCAEAAEAGFLGEDKMPLELEKIIDSENHTITFKLKEQEGSR